MLLFNKGERTFSEAIDKHRLVLLGEWMPNIFGKRISDELKQNYSFDADIENIVLKRSNEKGFYIEIEKMKIVGTNGLVINTSSISWDFNLVS